MCTSWSEYHTRCFLHCSLLEHDGAQEVMTKMVYSVIDHKTMTRRLQLWWTETELALLFQKEKEKEWRELNPKPFPKYLKRKGYWNLKHLNELLRCKLLKIYSSLRHPRFASIFHIHWLSEPILLGHFKNATGYTCVWRVRNINLNNNKCNDVTNNQSKCSFKKLTLFPLEVVKEVNSVMCYTCEIFKTLL